MEPRRRRMLQFVRLAVAVMRRNPIGTGLVLLLTLAAGRAFPQASDNQAWVRAATPSFELYTTEGEGNARAAILFLEQVRAFLARNNPGLRLPADAVRIVSLRSERDFRPFAAPSAPGAVFRPGIHHDTIVVQGLDPSRYPALVREYVRAVVGRFGAAAPYWLQQGLAEFYSTLKAAASAGSLRIGDIPAEHAASLARGRLLDLTALFDAREAPREQAPAFAAQCWALTHMLALTDQYRPKFPALVGEILSGVPSGQALQNVLGKSPAEIQTELAAYVKDAQYKAYVLPYGADRQLGQTSLRVASAVEWNMALADLDALAPERREQARRTYERLAAANPRRWEPYAGLGYLALVMQDRTAAARNFALAEELDCPDPRMYLDWAAMAPPASADEVISIYRKAAALRPEDAETAFRAGVGLASAGDCEGALRLLEPLKPAGADRQSAWRQAVDRCRPVVAGEQRRAVAPDSSVAAPTVKTTEGQLVQIDCMGSSARVWLQVAGRRLLFVITQGDSLTLVRGGKAVTEDLRCGPQPDAPRVRVQYGEPPAMEPGVQGALQVVEFL